jgi:hypothetical protein
MPFLQGQATNTVLMNLFDIAKFVAVVTNGNQTQDPNHILPTCDFTRNFKLLTLLYQIRCIYKALFTSDVTKCLYRNPV